VIKIIDLPYELVVSYFDIKIGPIVLIKIGSDISETGIGIPEDEITKLMEFHTDGDTFSHCYIQHDKTVSLNHCFAIKNNETRGGRYDLMISVLFKKQINISKKEYLYNILDNIENLELWLEEISEQISSEKNINSIFKSQNAVRLYKNDEIKSSLIRCLKRNVLRV
jgi:hypothetical protein